MTMEDANRLLGIAKANYSYAFKEMGRQEKIDLVQSWAFALQDIPADIVLLVFMQLVTTHKWLPTIAEIREQVQRLHYEALYEVDYECEMNPDMGKRQAAANARQYILECTSHLRTDSEPGLKLGSILRGGNTGFIGGGEMQLQGNMQIEGARGNGK